MGKISGNPEKDDQMYRLSIVVEDTKDFTSLELSKAAGVATSLFVFKNLADNPSENWKLWDKGRFGKIVRRAKTKDFNKLKENVEGFEYQLGNVNLYLVEPLMKEDFPKELSRTQVSGLTVLEEKEGSGEASTEFEKIKVVINSGLSMSPGKEAAATAHVLQSLVKNHELSLSALIEPDNILITRESITEDLKSSSKVVINDAGLTEVEPGSVTAVGDFDECFHLAYFMYTGLSEHVFANVNELLVGAANLKEFRTLEGEVRNLYKDFLSVDAVELAMNQALAIQYARVSGRLDKTIEESKEIFPDSTESDSQTLEDLRNTWVLGRLLRDYLAVTV